MPGILSKTLNQGEIQEKYSMKVQIIIQQIINNDIQRKIEEGYGMLVEISQMIEKSYSMESQWMINELYQMKEIYKKMMEEGYRMRQKSQRTVEETNRIIQQNRRITDESYLMIKESYLMIKESYRMIRERYQIIQEGERMVSESYQIIQEIQSMNNWGGQLMLRQNDEPNDECFYNVSQVSQGGDDSDHHSLYQSPQKQNDSRKRSPEGTDSDPTLKIANYQTVGTIQQKKVYKFNKKLIEKKIEKKMRNIKLIKYDMAIIVLRQLTHFLKYKSFDKIDTYISEFEKVFNEVKRNIDQNVDQEFQVFIERKFYSKEKFNEKSFNTNIFNIIASQLILNQKEKCTIKLKVCHKQLSNSWINLLDFQKCQDEKYLKLINQLQDYGILLTNNNSQGDYKKYHFLQITLDLLQNLKQKFYIPEIRHKILQLLEEIVEMRFHKYASKKAINFTKQNIIDLFYCNGELDEEAMKELDEEAMKEFEDILDKPMLPPKKKTKPNENTINA